MEIAFATPMPRDVKSFRLSRPVAERTSRLQFTACTFLTIAATGIWLFLLPLELLQLVAA